MIFWLECLGTGDTGGGVVPEIAKWMMAAREAKKVGTFSAEGEPTDIAAFLLTGCQSKEVCNGTYFPDLEKFADRFIDTVFISKGDQLYLKGTEIALLDENIGLRNIDTTVDAIKKNSILIIKNMEDTIAGLEKKYLPKEVLLKAQSEHEKILTLLNSLKSYEGYPQQPEATFLGDKNDVVMKDISFFSKMSDEGPSSVLEKIPLETGENKKAATEEMINLNDLIIEDYFKPRPDKQEKAIIQEKEQSIQEPESQIKPDTIPDPKAKESLEKIFTSFQARVKRLEELNRQNGFTNRHAKKLDSLSNSIEKYSGIVMNDFHHMNQLWTVANSISCLSTFGEDRERISKTPIIELGIGGFSRGSIEALLFINKLQEKFGEAVNKLLPNTFLLLNQVVGGNIANWISSNSKMVTDLERLGVGKATFLMGMYTNTEYGFVNKFSNFLVNANQKLFYSQCLPTRALSEKNVEILAYPNPNHFDGDGATLMWNFFRMHFLSWLIEKGPTIFGAAGIKKMEKELQNLEKETNKFCSEFPHKIPSVDKMQRVFGASRSLLFMNVDPLYLNHRPLEEFVNYLTRMVSLVCDKHHLKALKNSFMAALDLLQGKPSVEQISACYKLINECIPSKAEGKELKVKLLNYVKQRFMKTEVQPDIFLVSAARP